MIHYMNWADTKSGDLSMMERLSEFMEFVKSHVGDLNNYAANKKFYSELAAHFFESHDSGSKDWNFHRVYANRNPRCSIGYWSDFFVLTYLSGLSILVVTENEAHLFQVTNFDPYYKEIGEP